MNNKQKRCSEEELENQLHRQHAENDNNRSNVLISFIVGIVALFGFYGYVFVGTGNQNFNKYGFTFLDFSLMSILTAGILCFLAILTLHLGYSLRRDHLIVFRIRKKRFKKIGCNEIFGNSYSPLNKGWCDFLFDFYNLFFWLFVFMQIFVIATTYIKLKMKPDINNCLSILSLQLCFVFCAIVFRFCYYFKYLKMHKEEERSKYKKDKEKCKCLIYCICKIVLAVFIVGFGIYTVLCIAN